MPKPLPNSEPERTCGDGGLMMALAIFSAGTTPYRRHQPRLVHAIEHPTPTTTCSSYRMFAQTTNIQLNKHESVPAKHKPLFLQPSRVLPSLEEDHEVNADGAGGCQRTRSRTATPPPPSPRRHSRCGALSAKRCDPVASRGGTRLARPVRNYKKNCAFVTAGSASADQKLARINDSFSVKRIRDSRPRLWSITCTA
ncbi:unnamed protein product [Schistocephalus solidus]|uniref:Uncharacterized protein n=1 Tax=Schistocephalus solidus TaxID=70667 RepID=A0A183SPQ9_SCHSO|nr:unnamed protein product [Schistocephalus solidus]